MCPLIRRRKADATKGGDDENGVREEEEAKREEEGPGGGGRRTKKKKKKKKKKKSERRELWPRRLLLHGLFFLFLGFSLRFSFFFRSKSRLPTLSAPDLRSFDFEGGQKPIDTLHLTFHSRDLFLLLLLLLFSSSSQLPRQTFSLFFVTPIPFLAF